jgi:hypothetical protein
MKDKTLGGSRGGRREEIRAVSSQLKGHVSGEGFACRGLREGTAGRRVEQGCDT